MTRHEWLMQAVGRLHTAGCEDADFDARCLLEDIGGLGRHRLPDDTALSSSQEAALNEALAERLSGRPLQYILGEWEFLSLRLCVGEGVLIPRQDTETLCESVARRMAALASGRVLDLCAGSGCVGLGIASLCSVDSLTMMELSDEAMPYLQKNTARYRPDARIIKADVLTVASHTAGEWDVIVSNPPYIPTADLSPLQREVHREPRMALDGATDGLAFYRVIAADWTKKLAMGGLCAVEVGYGQAEQVRTLLAAAGLHDIFIEKDLAGKDRVVGGYR